LKKKNTKLGPGDQAQNGVCVPALWVAHGEGNMEIQKRDSRSNGGEHIGE